MIAYQAKPVPGCPIDAQRIPKRLKAVPRWVTWRASQPKPNGKFDKVPIDSATGRNVNANDPKNWKSFEEAHHAYSSGKCTGIGFALNAEPIEEDKISGLHLVAVDLDHCKGRSEEVRRVRAQLNNSFIEISPSKQGVHIFALSRKPISGGNGGGGHEIYGSGRFITVTGIHAQGDLQEATDALVGLEREWLPGKYHAQWPKTTESFNAEFEICIAKPATQENIKEVQEQLSYVSADCGYDLWRNIVWSILSTGWDCAEEIAREWSQSAPHRYDEKALNSVVQTFDPDGGITPGTLFHYACEGGWQRVAELAPAEHSKEVPRRLLTLDDIRTLPPISWIVKGILPARGLAAIYGQPGSGKTFLALDLALSIAGGQRSWFGARVKNVPVVYVALEGEGGIMQRSEAWEKEKQPLTTEPLRIVLGNFNLSNLVDVSALASEIIEVVGRHAVVFIDTLNQSSPGADENSSSDMGKLISHAKLLADKLEGLTVLVHHSGKDSSRGMRGHSSLLAAMDAVIEVTEKPLFRTWRIAKSKDSETGGERAFDLRSHLVGEDEDGQPIFSCAVKPSLLVPKPGTKKVIGKNQTLAMKTLTHLVDEHQDGIPLEIAIERVGKNLTCAARRKKTVAIATINNLDTGGHLRLINERVHLV